MHKAGGAITAKTCLVRQAKAPVVSKIKLVKYTNFNINKFEAVETLYWKLEILIF